MTERKMKDSGIPWIGMIPEEWRTSKIGELYTNRYERVSDKDFAPLSVTMQGILPQLETAAKTDDGDNRKLVRKGDILCFRVIIICLKFSEPHEPHEPHVKNQI